MSTIVQQHAYADGRTLALVQATPRTYKVIIQSKTTHETQGIAFVQMLRYAKINGYAKAFTTFNKWKTENA